MSTVNLAFGYHSNGDHSNPHWYIDHPNLEGVYYGSEAQAKAKMRKAITEQIEEALTARANYQETYIGCHDGTVLHVRYKYSWGYEITGPGRGHNSSCGANGGYQDALDSARRHADTYGGIAWEAK